MKPSTLHALARMFYRKLRLMGLPREQARRETAISLAWARLPRYAHITRKLFGLSRACYCLTHQE